MRSFVRRGSACHRSCTLKLHAKASIIRSPPNCFKCWTANPSIGRPWLLVGDLEDPSADVVPLRLDLLRPTAVPLGRQADQGHHGWARVTYGHGRPAAVELGAGEEGLAKKAADPASWSPSVLCVGQVVTAETPGLLPSTPQTPM